QADAVAAAIAAAREAARSRGASAPGGPDQAPDWPGNGAGRPEEEIRDLGCRVGWCAVGCLLFAPAGCAIWCFQTAAGIGTAPVALHVLSSSLLCWAFSGYLGLLGVLLALFYFHAVARLGWAPRGSAATLGSTLLCALPSMWLLLSVG
ncbi:MAG: hypothetical protein JXQ29_17010, partial [Planctomycetes bacterium]|nr:hypothetical protein [Planctomycetota bacterium]